ncbi:MAG: hypothetical protein R2851_23130 [Caldilineaceae bacterium]
MDSKFTRLVLNGLFSKGTADLFYVNVGLGGSAQERGERGQGSVPLNVGRASQFLATKGSVR